MSLVAEIERLRDELKRAQADYRLIDSMKAAEIDTKLAKLRTAFERLITIEANARLKAVKQNRTLKTQ